MSHIFYLTFNKTKLYLLLLLFSLIHLPSFGQYQKKRELQQQKKALYQQIADTENLLRGTRLQHKNSLHELQLLEEQIANRQKVIQNIQAEIRTLNTNVRATNLQIDSLKNQLQQLQTAYAQTIRQAYLEHNPYDKLLFLFSAKNFNDAYRRFKYVQYYAAHRKQQFTEIQTTKDTLTHKRKDLEQKKTEKEQLLSNEKAEKQKLEREEASKNTLIAELQQKADNLEEQITTKQQAAQTLEQELQVVIQEIARREAEERARKERERREAAERARKERERQAAIERAKRIAAQKRAAEEKAKRAAQQAATRAAKKAAEEKARQAARARKAAEEKARKATAAKKATEAKAKQAKPKKAAPKQPVDGESLTNAFAKRKGRLIWPVVSGVITGRFGRNRHPVLKHITTTNNGIDISTYKAATVRALYNGTVSNILYNPSFHWAVIVKHGTYFTVYSNLSKVTVKKNAKVKTNQVMGVVHHNPKAGKSEVHLEIWKGSQKVNPIHWLQRR